MTRTRPRRYLWLVIAVQAGLVAAYAYAAVAFITSDAEFFSEEAPPGWSWPAVIVVGVGYIPALICLVVAIVGLASPDLRANRHRWLSLVATSAATVIMLLIMASPAGWELFDWYVS